MDTKAETIGGITWEVFHDGEGFSGKAANRTTFFLSLNHYERGVVLADQVDRDSGTLFIRPRHKTDDEIIVSGTVGDLLKVAALAAKG